MVDRTSTILAPWTLVEAEDKYYARDQGPQDDRAPHRVRARAMSGEYLAPRWLAGAHAQTIYPALSRPPAIAFRRERVDTPDGDFVDFDWQDANGAAPDTPTVVLFHGLEGQLVVALCARADAALAGDRLARRRSAFPRLQRRAEPPAARLSFRRLRRDRLDALDGQGAPAGGAAVRGRRIAGRQRAAQLARARAGASARRRWSPRRPCPRRSTWRRPGTAIGQGLQPHLCAALPVDAGAEGARHGAALSRARSTPPPSAGRTIDARVRRRRHRAAARLRRRRRLLAARQQQAVARRHCGADAGAQRKKRSVHSGELAARRRVGQPRRDARAACAWRPRGLRDVPVSRKPGLAAEPPATILRAERSRPPIARPRRTAAPCRPTLRRPR